MNKQAAREWLEKAWHNLSAARLLHSADHYSDVTAVELHYAAEKSLKAMFAFQNKKIPKTHDLSELHASLQELIMFNEKELVLLDIITEYHIEESYPQYERLLPASEEIKKVLSFVDELFEKICGILAIDPSEVKR